MIQSSDEDFDEVSFDDQLENSTKLTELQESCELEKGGCDGTGLFCYAVLEVDNMLWMVHILQNVTEWQYAAEFSYSEHQIYLEENQMA